jgi:folate-dependent phosphoribosylglycinamide formyltransferase PurN
MELLYKPTGNPMNVAVLFSGGASSFRAMLSDPNYGKLYRVVAGLTHKKTKNNEEGRGLFDSKPLPVVYNDWKKLVVEGGMAQEKYYEKCCRDLEQYHPDLVCLSGWFHWIKDPMLSEYGERIWSVHPADQTILAGPSTERMDVSLKPQKEVRKLKAMHNLEPKFVGDDTVMDAIMAGETQTRCTIHIVTAEKDAGTIAVQSRAFPIDEEIQQKAREGRREEIVAYKKSLQNFMKISGDGPAYLKAIEIAATGRLIAHKDTAEFPGKEEGEIIIAPYTALFLDNKELPFCGHRLGE